MSVLELETLDFVKSKSGQGFIPKHYWIANLLHKIVGESASASPKETQVFYHEKPQESIYWIPKS